MSLNVKNESGDFTPAPAGNHVGICYAVIDLGTQHQDAFTWEGKPIAESNKPQILIMWEIPAEQVEIDGEMKPVVISKFYNAFLSERANLRIHLEAWRGKGFSEEELAGFNIGNLLGKACMVNIVHTDKGKAKVAGIASIPKGLAVPEQVNESILFDLDNYNQGTFEKISEGIQNIIKRSPEWQKLNPPAQGFRSSTDNVPHGQAPDDPDFTDDDIPF